MKKILIPFALTASLSAFAEIPEIDSSKWKTDPVNFGMTAKEFIQAESRAFISNFIARIGINQWFIGFTYYINRKRYRLFCMPFML